LDICPTGALQLAKIYEKAGKRKEVLKIDSAAYKADI